MTYDRWKTRSPDDDLNNLEPLSREQEELDYLDEQIQLGRGGRMSAFHWKDGWMFARGEAGHIHIWKLDKGQPTEIEIAIPPGEWASILNHLDPQAKTETENIKRALERAEGYIRSAAWRETSDPPHELGQATKDLADIHAVLSACRVKQ